MPSKFAKHVGSQGRLGGWVSADHHWMIPKLYYHEETKAVWADVWLATPRGGWDPSAGSTNEQREKRRDVDQSTGSEIGQIGRAHV